MAPRKLGAKKERGTLKIVPPVSTLEKSIPDHVKRRAAKIDVFPCMKIEENGTPFSAVYAVEGKGFENDWCSRCEHDSEEDKPCTIKTEAIAEGVSPEWLWYERKTLCKAFDYTQATLDEDWKSHVSKGIAYHAPSVDYEPLAYSNPYLNELVVNSMMSHWCHACEKKESCTGFKGLVADKTDLPDYWLWVKKHPVCIKFMPKIVVVQIGTQGTLIQRASEYRGYKYWIETIPNSSLYAGFYQKSIFEAADDGRPNYPIRLGHDQVSAVLTARILRDAIDEVTRNETPSEWVKNYLKHFPSTPKKKKSTKASDTIKSMAYKPDKRS